jgi:hypothetical protein
MLCSLKLFVYIEVLQLLMGGPDIPFGEGTSNKAAGESSSAKRPRGRPVKVVHFHDDLGPTHFAKMVLSSGLEMLPIATGFHPYLGTVPRTIILKTNTGCSRMVNLRDMKGTRLGVAWIFHCPPDQDRLLSDVQGDEGRHLQGHRLQLHHD